MGALVREESGDSSGGPRQCHQSASGDQLLPGILTYVDIGLTPSGQDCVPDFLQTSQLSPPFPQENGNLSFGSEV